MNGRHLFVIVSGVLVLGIIWFVMPDSETPSLTEQSQISSAAIMTEPLPKPTANDTAAPEEFVFHTPSPKQAEVQAVETKETKLKPSLEKVGQLLEQTREELRLEEGLSAFNLMLLQDLAVRLNEHQSHNPSTLLAHNAEWPDEFRETLQRLNAALQAEAAFQEAWQQQASKDPHAYREAYLSQQKQILGDALFQKIHAEDTITIDDAGLSAHFTSKENNPELQSDAHQKKLQLLQQWHQNELSETELRQELTQSLSSEEINQLIETGSYEANWLTSVEAFLDEYRYIEQAGIIGEDERLMRQELIDKHFSPENRQIANQFLFSPQTKQTE